MQKFTTLEKYCGLQDLAANTYNGQESSGGLAQCFQTQ
jgi:hypothetical protein